MSCRRDGPVTGCNSYVMGLLRGIQWPVHESLLRTLLFSPVGIGPMKTLYVMDPAIYKTPDINRCANAFI